MKFKLMSFFLFFLIYQHILYSQLDLKTLSQDFVLETKRIRIPGYPHAFNPSIIRWQGKLLMSFRDIPDPKKSFESRLGLLWLDNDFNAISHPQLLDTQMDSPIPSRAEDSRLIQNGDTLYLVYSDNRDKLITKGGFRVYIGELKFDGKNFFLYNIDCLYRFEGESLLQREKNWVPFIYEQTLLLAYSLNPHIIFLPHIGKGECETMSVTFGKIKWDWGELRGGTPGLISNENQYLAFFHSSKKMETLQSDGKPIPHYFIGAYTFSSTPPFEIKKISKEPIIGKNFYEGTSYKPYWGPLKVVFPGGFIFDENYIWLAYGKQDHETWIVKFDKEKLLKSLIPVQQETNLTR